MSRCSPPALAKGSIVRLKVPLEEMTVVEVRDSSLLLFRGGLSGWGSKDDVVVE